MLEKYFCYDEIEEKTKREVDSMKNTTRNILLGVGAAVAIGAAYMVTSDRAMEKAESMINRKRAKYFVKDKLHGNEKAMKVVENLSDDEVINLLNVVDKVSNLRGSVNDYTHQLKDATMEFTELLSDKKDTLVDKVKK